MNKAHWSGYTEVGHHFGLKPGQWTDDTSMGLCLADALLENDGRLDDIVWGNISQ